MIARSTCYRASHGSADDTALVEAMHAIKDEFEAMAGGACRWRCGIAAAEKNRSRRVVLHGGGESPSHLNLKFVA